MNRFAPPWLLLALLTVPAAAAEPALPAKFDIEAIDAYLAAQVKPDGYVCLSVALVRDGKVVLAKGYGKQSLKTEAAVEPGTLFAAGSVTKQFTAACVFLLAEEGKLSVRDP